MKWLLTIFFIIYSSFLWTTPVFAQVENSQAELANQSAIIISLLALCILFFILHLVMVKKTNKLEKSNNEMKGIFDNMQEGFALHEIICDQYGKPMDYRYIDANIAFEKNTGLKIDDIRNKTVKEILPNTENYWIEKYGQVALTGVSTSFSNYSKELKKHFSVSVYSPKIGQFATVFTDITKSKQLEQVLREEKALFKTILYSLGDGVISTDTEGKVDMMNVVAEELTGWSSGEAKGKDFEEVFKIINEFTQEIRKSPVKRVFELGETTELDEYTLLIKKNGKHLPIEHNAAPIKDEKGNVKGVVVVVRDYTEKKEKQAEIAYLSYHDQLTGLYNRRFFEEELKRLDTKRNLPFTIVMIDVNGLKLTNDAFGHLVGDKLLRRVAVILKSECRTDDIISRIGGDEFVILLPKTNNEETENIVKRIYVATEKEQMDNIVISVSIGWETKISDDQQMKDIFIKAEEYMYRKKITESQNMRNKTVEVILNTLNENNEAERAHAEKVSILAKHIGAAMNFNDKDIREIEITGLMHDIGKIAINPSILNKPGIFTQVEYDSVKKHSESGYQILKSVNIYASLAQYVLSHHERWDGSGYPRGLQGNEIPVVSRIITVADAYDAMISDRPYRNAFSKELAIEELKKHSGTQFDPEIITVFIEKVLNDL